MQNILSGIEKPVVVWRILIEQQDLHVVWFREEREKARKLKRLQIADTETSLPRELSTNQFLSFFALFACPVDLREHETGWASPRMQKLGVKKENGRANFVNWTIINFTEIMSIFALFRALRNMERWNLSGEYYINVVYTK